MSPYPGGMDIAETIAERRIREAMAQGLFDNLAGAGKPIDDLDGIRESGWWAKRIVAEERDRAAHDR